MSNSYEGWVSVEALEKEGFKLTYWMDYYGQLGKIIVPPPNTKRYLRISPYDDAEIITQLNEDFFEIEVIAFNEEGNTSEGSSCKVKATKFIIHPCNGGEYDTTNIIKVFEGWLKIIDNNGQRLVYHNPWGC